MNKTELEEIADCAFRALDFAGSDPRNLPIPSQTIVLVYSSQGIIDNGGLECFFSTDFPEHPPYTLFVNSYLRIGATQAARCIEQAAAIFPFPEPHLHEQQRQQFMASLSADHPFARLSNRICGDDSVWELLCAYAIKHKEEIMGEM
ncbi:DUF4375 domain-containing protein [Chitinimonas sp.]|uniref:DMP19 family protein n=1 Tax=Chitinimonas sp. TaxID=1934313 RepID=UPI0035B04A60